jgi:adenylate cyclase
MSLRFFNHIVFLLYLLLVHSVSGFCSNQPAGTTLVDSLKKAVTGYEQAGDTSAAALAAQTLASDFLREGNYPEALKHFLYALKWFEHKNDMTGIASCHRSIGFIFAEQGNYAEALRNLNISRETYVKLKDIKGLTRCQLTIGYLYEKMGRFNEALGHYTANLKLARETNDSLGIAGASMQMGATYIKLGDYPRALEMEQTALEQYQRANKPLDIATAYGYLANICMKQMQYDKGRDFLRKGLSLVLENGSLPNAMIFYKELSDLEATQGNYKTALEYNKQYNAIRDTLLNSEKSQEVYRLKMQYDYDKKEAYERTVQLMKDELNAKTAQRQKLIRNGFIIGFAIVLISALMFFVQRNRIRNEKKRSDALLLNILPAAVATELKDNGTAAARYYEEVTVLFADIKGFTAYAEQLSAAELVHAIDELFSAFDEITTRHGIEKIKTIGDSYMCAAGIPVPVPTHAVDTVTAALEMQQFMLNFNPSPQGKALPPLQLRIGIHTGPVVAGVVGSKKFAYDIWGDTVNTASGLESGGEPGRVNISGATYEIVKDHFDCLHRGKVKLKSKEAADMYFVSGKRGV